MPTSGTRVVPTHHCSAVHHNPRRVCPAPVRMHAANTTTTSTTHRLPPIHHLQAVLFDVDGTLVNSDPLHYAAFRQILLQHDFNDNQPISLEFFRQHISGRHNPDIAADLFPHWDAARGAAFSDTKEQMFREMVLKQGLTAMSGLHAFLDALQAAGVRIAAVTNAPKPNVAVMLQSLQLTSVFETLVYGEDCTHAKPHPEPYLVAMRALGVDDAARVLVLEDSPSGVRAGAAAGAAVAAITSGHDPVRLVEAGADVTVADFDQLLPLLLSLDPTPN